MPDIVADQTGGLGILRKAGGETVFRLQRSGAGIAVRHSAGRTPGLVFLPGFHSDMTGQKAETLAATAIAAGRQFTRFDYQGHGASDGRFEDGTIGLWLDDAIAVLDQVTTGPQVLVGSSMGGWMMVLLARARPQRVAGLVGIAAAADFTEELIWNRLSSGERTRLIQDGALPVPNRDDDPYSVTLRLVEEGRRHLVLPSPIALACPVRLIHGMADPDVPWQTSVRLAERLTGPDVQVILVKDGEHRMSRPADLALLVGTVQALVGGS